MRVTRRSAARPAPCGSSPAPTHAVAAGRARARPSAACTPKAQALAPHSTHEVRNQVPPLAGYDVADDPALLEAADREGAGWAAGELHTLGRLAGSAATAEQARLANEHPPVLRSHDRW